MKTIKKNGRPPLQDDKRREAIIKVYCQPGEKNKIIAEAKAAGLTISDYAKRRLFGQRIVMNYNEIFKELHEIGTEFSRSGNNINQLAKHANTLNKMGKLSPAIVESLSLVLDDYTAKKEQVRVALRKAIRELAK